MGVVVFVLLVHAHFGVFESRFYLFVRFPARRRALFSKLAAL